MSTWTSQSQMEQPLLYEPGTDPKDADGDAHSHKSHPIFDAIKSGMLVPVQAIVEQEGPDILSMRDEKGHTPAHWACLGGHTAILRYVLEHKAPVNEPSNNDLGARPIHWACVNGHIAITDILIQAGVSLDITDNKGCTPLIVAAQYGQTMLAGYLMGKGARLQMVDRDGDTALHWAAFKGKSELMRLLIYSGFNPRQKDNFGQTPLHLACINGDLTSVRELCEQDGVELGLPDKNGKTPLMLATGRKHIAVIDYLKAELKQKTSFMPKIDFWSIVFGPPGNSKGPLLFFFCNLLLWGYPMYIIKCLPYTWYDLQLVHTVFFFMNVVMWFCLFHCSTTDPGYLPRNIPEYDMAIKQVAHFDEWKQGDNPLSRLCHTCRTVKPLRSKHCKVCNRCVKVFDHHCPYIYNCVGVNNRVTFTIFCYTVMVNGALTIFLSLYTLRVTDEEWNIVYMFYMAVGIFFEGVSSYVFLTMIYLSVVNLTTNEYINYKRYKHFKDKDGSFKNPFDSGWKFNVLEFFKIIPQPPEFLDPDDYNETPLSTLVTTLQSMRESIINDMATLKMERDSSTTPLAEV
ncbi:uncharacterized protein LOC132732310 isoform X2 [Ruditapes philippinarum]|uniref:uncharacterized protein LOC132714697 isoform X1 n=1 Tax=Ruditapes philippinarum TaxID=129788 RepID=UPI00295ADB08|nr:uncharacterized protein LOC132714697 isoform X1 [Ruditapes philippinarum]XP_060574687.1 uncharacterized protein LOC132732310 isoform X2 [Ruditapes philippinarum]